MLDTKMREDIIEALNQLVDEKTISEITMKEIAIKCGVSRQTIYYHFSNLEELFDCAFEVRLEHFITRVKQYHTAKSVVKEMITVAQYTHEIATPQYKRKHKIRIEKMIKRILVEVLDESFSYELSKSEYERMIDFYTYAMTGILFDIGKEKENIDKLSEQLYHIMIMGFKFNKNLTNQ